MGVVAFRFRSKTSWRFASRCCCAAAMRCAFPWPCAAFTDGRGAPPSLASLCFSRALAPARRPAL